MIFFQLYEYVLGSHCCHACAIPLQRRL